MAKVYFSTGSNQGDRLNSLVQAAELIENKIGLILDYSPVVESEPWGFEADTTFYNQVLEVETELNPQQLLNLILEIESTLGRKRSGNQYSSRTIDIDILFYDDQQICEDNLIIPHPLLHKRKFVLQPLCSFKPNLIHPVFKTSITHLLDQMNKSNHITHICSKDDFALKLNPKP